MSEAIILIGGIPCSGKSTTCKTLKSFLNAAEVEVVEPVKLFKCEKHGDVLFLGRFPEHTRTCGTDTTSDAAIPKLAKFLKVVKRQYKYVVIEGDKFFSKRIVPKLLQSEPNAHAYTLCVSPIFENERRAKRGDEQDPSWVKGRHTKVENVKNAVMLCSDDVRRRFHTEKNNTMGQMYKTVEKILGYITSKIDAKAAILGIDKKIHHKDILYSLRPFIYKVFNCDTNQRVEEHKNVDRLLKGALAKTADQQKFKLFKNGKLHNLVRKKIETAVTNEKNWDENSHLKILLIGDGQTFRIEKHLPPVDDDDDLEREDKSLDSDDNITMAKKTQKTLPKGKKKFAKAGKTASKSKKGGAVVKSKNTPKTGKKKGRK